jgi:hypothetical protein
MAVPIVAFPPQNIIGFVAFFSWLSVPKMGSYKLFWVVKNIANW